MQKAKELKLLRNMKDAILVGNGNMNFTAVQFIMSQIRNIKIDEDEPLKQLKLTISSTINSEKMLKEILLSNINFKNHIINITEESQSVYRQKRIEGWNFNQENVASQNYRSRNTQSPYGNQDAQAT